MIVKWVSLPISKAMYQIPKPWKASALRQAASPSRNRGTEPVVEIIEREESGRPEQHRLTERMAGDEIGGEAEGERELGRPDFGAEQPPGKDDQEAEIGEQRRIHDQRKEREQIAAPVERNAPSAPEIADRDLGAGAASCHRAGTLLRRAGSADCLWPGRGAGGGLATGGATTGAGA